MGLLSNIFRKKKEEPANDDPLIPVPVPPLISVLAIHEQRKGAPLTEEEVLQARDRAVSILLPLSKKHEFDRGRGFVDIDPENVWQEWLIVREMMNNAEE